MDPEKTDASEVIIDTTATRVEPTEMPTEELNNAEQAEITQNTNTPNINNQGEEEGAPEETTGAEQVIERDNRGNTTLYGIDGTTKSFHSSSSVSGATHLAEAGYKIIEDTDRKPSPKPEGHSRVTNPNYKDIVRGHKAPKNIAEPHLKNINTGERKKDRSKLNEADLFGIRQNDQARSHHVAELVKVKEAIKTYDQELRQGKSLTEDEYSMLKESHLRSFREYTDRENYYERLGLSKEDKDVLMEKHFEKQITDFNDSLKDQDGNYNSSNCSIEQLQILKDAEKKKISSLHYQDRTARQEDSVARNRAEREAQYKKDFEEKHGIPWSVQAERLLQDRNLLTRERDLYREASEKKNEDNQKPEEKEEVKAEVQEETVNNIAEKEKILVERAKKRDLKKILFWTGVATGGAIGVLATGPVIAAAAGVATIGTLGSAIVEKISMGTAKKLTTELASIKDKDDEGSKARREEILNKLKKIERRIERLQNIRSFFTGGGLGLLGGSLINGFFMQGKGLIETIRAGQAGNQIATGNLPGGENIASSSNEVATGQISEPTTTGQVIEQEVVSGTIKTPPTIEVAQSIPSDLGNTFNSGLSYQQATELGWRGTNLSLTEAGGTHGLIQGEFFNRINSGLGNNPSLMQGFEAAKAYNPFLRAAVSGSMGVEEAASQAIQAIQALP